MTMTVSMWDDVLRDPFLERREAALDVAMEALTPQYASLMEATTEDGFHDRRAVLGSEIERKVQAACGKDGVLFATVHSAILSQMEADWHRVQEHRVRQSQKRNRPRAFRRRHANYSQADVDVVNWASRCADRAGSASVSQLSGPDLLRLIEIAGSPQDEDARFAKREAEQAGGASVRRVSGTTVRRLVDEARSRMTFAGSRKDAAMIPKRVPDDAAPYEWGRDYYQCSQCGYPFPTPKCDNPMCRESKSDEVVQRLDERQRAYEEQQEQLRQRQRAWEQSFRPREGSVPKTASSDYYFVQGYEDAQADRVTWPYQTAGSVAAEGYASGVAAFRRGDPIPQVIADGAKAWADQMEAEYRAEQMLDGNFGDADPSFILGASRKTAVSHPSLEGAAQALAQVWGGPHATISAPQKAEISLVDGPYESTFITVRSPDGDQWGINDYSGMDDYMGRPHPQGTYRVWSRYEPLFDIVYVGGSTYEAQVHGQTYTITVGASKRSARQATKERTLKVIDGDLRRQGIFSRVVPNTKIALTVVHDGGQFHYAVTDEDGGEEKKSGSGATVRQVLEEAWDALNKVLDHEPPPPAEVAKQVEQAADATGEAVEESGGAAPDDGDSTGGTVGDAPPADGETSSAPESDSSDGKSESEGGDQAPEAPPEGGSDEGVSEDAPPKPEQAAEPSTEAPAEDAVPTDDASAEEAVPPAAPDGGSTAEDVVDTAEEISGGDVVALDPNSMTTGQQVNMTYTLTDGTTGNVDVTFIRADNEIFFFDGPAGEFGIGDRDGEWVDSEGNKFDFSDGDAMEEVTGEDLPDDAQIDDIDLDAVVDSKGEPVMDTETDNAADTETDNDDDDDDDDDWRKKVESIKAVMRNENPNLSEARLNTLARRAVLMAKELTA